MKKLTAIIILCAVLPTRAASIPDQQSVFSRLSVMEGLSQCTVSSIVQDRDGFMWFATFDGLNRYDGFDITVFRHREGDRCSLVGDMVRKLYVDSLGTLWVGTDKGLSWFDPLSESFHNIMFEDVHIFNDFVELSDDRMLVSSSSRSFFVDIRKREVAATGDVGAELVSIRPRMFLKMKDCIYMGTGDGELFRYDIADGSVRDMGVDLGGRSVMSLCAQSEDVLWIGTEGSGLFRLQLSTGNVRHYSADVTGGISSNYVRALCFDNTGKLWIGTGDNLSILDARTGEVTNIKACPETPHSLSNSSVKTIFRDASGGMWLGTYYGGVNYYHSQRDNFRVLDYAGGVHQITGCITVDSEGGFWIGTNRDGVLNYNPSTGRTNSLILSGEEDGSVTRDIKVISFSDDGSRVYVGAALGRMREYCIADGSSRNHSNTPHSVHAILSDGDGGLWLGSLSGLFHYDLASESCVRVDFSDVTSDRSGVLCLMTDSMGETWMGTETGVVKCTLSFKDGEARISSPEFFTGIRWAADIIESSRGIVWVASMNGLYRYDRSADSGMYHVNEGYRCSRIIRTIEEDSSGRLWMGTENGLVCYNPLNGKFRNYTSGDGLPSNVFTMYSSARDQRGNLYFGGTRGIVCFSPDHIPENGESPSPVITGVFATGRDERLPIKDGCVTISPGTGRFQIRFSVTDYVSWKGSRFQYRMKGVDDEWLDADASRSVSYSSLPKGRHLFEVRCANDSGLWNYSPASLLVRVRPRWYKTTAAYVIAIILSLLAVWQIIRSRIARNDRKNLARIENLKARLYVESPGSITDSEVAFLNSVISIIETNMSNERFSVEDLAGKMNVSRTGLHTKIKAITGNSALALIKRLRFEEASRLLKETEMPIAEIGSAVGFSSSTYFATNFKEIFGLAPKDYRKKNKI